MVTCLELRITSNIGQPPLNRLILSYSFHLCVTSFAFLVCGVFPMLWRLAVAVSSLTQLFKRFRASLRSTNGPLALMNYYLVEADFYLSLLEFMTLVSLMFNLRYTNKIVGFLLSIFYFFCFMLYRYATNAVHRQLWNTFSFHVVRFAGTLPCVLGDIAMAALALANAVGTTACRCYALRKSDTNTSDQGLV
jgi:hypothetical protein